MTAFKTCMSLVILAAAAAAPAFAAGYTTPSLPPALTAEPQRVPATPPAAHAPDSASSNIAGTVSAQGSSALQRGFAQGVREGGGPESLAQEGSENIARPQRTAARTRHIAIRPMTHTEVSTTADLNKAQLQRK